MNAVYYHKSPCISSISPSIAIIKVMKRSLSSFLHIVMSVDWLHFFEQGNLTIGNKQVLFMLIVSPLCNSSLKSGWFYQMPN